MTLALALVTIALAVLTVIHRTSSAFLLTLGALFFWLASSGVHLVPAEAPLAPVAQAAPAAGRGPLIVVPEPDPAARGILLDRWARATATLTPLN
jgi:hypothetical protein